MHSSSHDAKLGAAADSGLTPHVVDIVVLTTDGGLLATLREACGPQHAIWHAQTADACVDLLVGGRCGILIADLGTLRGDVASLLDRLHSQFPELVMIASGKRGDEHNVAALMSDGRIYRFMHKPLSPARANQFVNAATRRYAELRHVEPLMITTVKAIAAHRNWGAIAASIVAGLGAFFLLVIWLSANRTPEPVFTSGSYATDSTQRIADALGRAQIAYLAGRLADPKGDNALEYFESVLALQPDHPEAQAGITRVIDALEARVTSALEARDAAKGVVALTRLQRARPDHPRLDELRAELISLARGVGSEATPTPPRPAEPRPARSPPAPEQTAATPNIQAARSSIAVDQLIEPADDNALMYLRRARDANESESLLRIVATDLGMRLIDKASEADSLGDDLQAARWSEAARLIGEEFGVSLPDLGDIRAPGNALIEAEEGNVSDHLAAAIALRQRGQLIEPSRANAYEHLMAVREQIPDSTEFLAEQQRLVFALLESARAALAAGELDRAELLTQRADTLLPGMTTTRTLLQQIEEARAGN